MPAKRMCVKCQKLRVATQFAGLAGRVCNPCKREGARSNARARHLGETYEITPDEYAAILAAQDGKCAGCGGTRRYALHVDHDHKLETTVGTRGSIRGLLCARCNKVLRDIRDSAPALVRLAAYLHDPPARKVLR